MEVLAQQQGQHALLALQPTATAPKVVQPKVKPAAAQAAAAAANAGVTRLPPLLSYAQDIPSSGHAEMLAICNSFKPKSAADQLGFTYLCRNHFRKGCMGPPKCTYYHPAPVSDDAWGLVRDLMKAFPDCKFTCV